MALPSEPVTLSVTQITELHQKLRDMRHDVNNKLSLIAAYAELIRRRPDETGRLLNSVAEQPGKISEMVAQFSRDVESVLGITRS